MMVRRWMQGMVLALVSVAATGCHRRTKLAPPVPLPPAAKVELVPAPEPETQGEVAEQPLAAIPAPTKAVQPKIRKVKKVEPVEVLPAPAPVQVAAAEPPPAAAVIGSLTTGGAAAPAEQQKAGASIAEVEKRLASLPAATLDAQKDGMARVRNFLKQAHDALSSGDADGAMTLATKARVLLDDLLK
jgi:hypothetical protein